VFSGEVTYELKIEDISAVVIINARYRTAVHRIRSFLLAESDYRFLLHAGLLFQETGSWILQDGPLSFSAFSSLFRSTSCNGTGPVDLAVSVSGDWNLKDLSRLVNDSRVRMPTKPTDGMENPADDIDKFAEQVSLHLEPHTVLENLPATEVVGNMSFTKPTMYIFSGGDGSSSLFCINGCNILVDGGFGRQCCMWSLVRHFETIDAVLVTSLAEKNILGISAFLERKVLEDVYPRIGTVFINTLHTAKDAKVKVSEVDDELNISLSEESCAVAERLRKLNVQPFQCFVSTHGSHSVNIFHRIGYGSLDMYILSPAADSKEWKDYSDSKSTVSLAPTVSAVIVFRPSAPGARPTRILFSGSTSQLKIFAGCDHFRMLTLFQSASGLPKDKPAVRPSSVSRGEKTLVVPASKPRAPSVGSASAGSRVPNMKRPTDVRVKVPTSSAMSCSASATSATKAVSKELLKSIHPSNALKKPMKKLQQGDRSVKLKPQSFMMNEDRKITAVRQEKEVKNGSKSSHDLKGSASTGSHRAAFRIEASTGTKPVMLMKSKKAESGGIPKAVAKHASEPHTVISQSATEELATVDDKPADENVEEEVAVAAESDVNEHQVEKYDGIHEQGTEKPNSIDDKKTEPTDEKVAVAAESDVSEHPAEKYDGSHKEGSEKTDTFNDKVTKPTEEKVAMVVESDAENYARNHEQFAEVSNTPVESTDAELPTVSALPLEDAEIVAQNEPAGIATDTAENAQPDEVNCKVFILKPEPEGDIDEKDIDTTEADHGASEIVAESHLASASPSKNNCEENVNACEEVLPSASDVTLNRMENGSSIGVIDGSEIGQFSADEKDAVSTSASSEQPNNPQPNHEDISHDIGLGSDSVVGPTSIEISDLKADENFEPCVIIDKAGHSEDSEVERAKDIEPTSSSIVVAGDAENKDESHQTSLEFAEFDTDGTAAVDSSMSRPSETQQKVADEDNKVHDPTAMDEDTGESHIVDQDHDIIDAENSAPSIVEGGLEVPQANGNTSVEENSELMQDNATDLDSNIIGDNTDISTDNTHGDGKQLDEGDSDVFQDDAVDRDSNTLVTKEPLSIVVTDNSDVPEGNVNNDGKPFGEISHDNSIDEGYNVVGKQKCLTTLEQDNSKVLEDNGGVTLDGSGNFNPQRDWEAPQQLPAPLNKNEQKSTDGTKQPGVDATKKPTGMFKVPAPKTKKGTTHRDDLYVTDIVGSSRPTEGGTRGRLSLQAGELKLPSLVGQRKTHSATVKPIVPFYVDLVSLPVSATGSCTVNADFFRRIRARYYVVNSSDPDPRVLEFLADGITTWESPVEPVTVIPTGNAESLLEWYSTHCEQMTALQISVSPSASQCAVELQGYSCSAYRLEF